MINKRYLSQRHNQGEGTGIETPDSSGINMEWDWN